MITYKNIYWSIAIFFLLFGCSHHHVPKPHNYQIEIAEEFTSTSSISLINSQTSTEEVLFATNGPHKFYANYQEFTEAAINLARQELVKRGMTVEEQASKTLNLSIESTKVTIGFAMIDSDTTLKVETGEGYSKEYNGNSSIFGISYAVIYATTDNSITDAVAKMFNDPQVIEYLTK